MSSGAAIVAEPHNLELLDFIPMTHLPVRGASAHQLENLREANFYYIFS
jgi:hypothetical protein